MIHQPSGGTQGTAADIEIQAQEILYLRAQAERAVGQAHGPAGGADRARHGPRPLHVGRRGQGVRHRRQRDRASRRARRATNSRQSLSDGRAPPCETIHLAGRPCLSPSLLLDRPLRWTSSAIPSRLAAACVSRSGSSCPTINTFAAPSAESRRTRSGSSSPARRSTSATSASRSATRSSPRTKSAR